MTWNFDARPQKYGIKPYIIRAYWEWIVDNNEIPMIRIVRKFTPTTVFPDGLDPDTVTLDVSIESCPNFEIDNDFIHMKTRFGGTSWKLKIDIGAVVAIFSHEGTRGTVLPVFISDGVDLSDAKPESSDQSPPPPTRGKPTLRIVK